MDLICYTLVLLLAGHGVLSQTTESTVTTTVVPAADTTIDLTATTASSDITTQSPASVTDATTMSAVTATASSDSTTAASSESTTVSSESTTVQVQGVGLDSSTRGPFFNQPVYTVPTAAPPAPQQQAPVYYSYPYTQPYQQVYRSQPGYNNIPYYYQPAPKPVQYYQPTSYYQQRSYYRQPYQQPNNLFNMFYMMMFDLF